MFRPLITVSPRIRAKTTLRKYMSSNFIEVKDKRIHYLDWNSTATQKPVILLIHGFNQTAHSWDEFCPRVTDNYRPIAIDQRGHGESFHSTSKDYSRPSMAEDIKDFIDYLNLKQVVLVGMSMGAANSVTFASKYPEHVKSLVLVDWAPEIQKEGISNISKMLAMNWKSFEDAVDSVHRANPRRTKENVQTRLKYTIHQKEPGIWTWKADLSAWEQKHNFEKHDPPEVMWNIVKTISCPTLLLMGKESDILSESMACKMREVMPKCTLKVINGAGHSVAGDNPNAFYEEVLRFANDTL